MATKELLGQMPTSLKGLMLYKHLYYSRWKEDKKEFSNLFRVGAARFKRTKWLYNDNGKICGEVLDRRTYRGYEQLSRQVVKHFPNLFTKADQKEYLKK